jgi:hypothetical protein
MAVCEVTLASSNLLPNYLGARMRNNLRLNGHRIWVEEKLSKEQQEQRRALQRLARRLMASRCGGGASPCSSGALVGLVARGSGWLCCRRRLLHGVQQRVLRAAVLWQVERGWD